MIIGEMFDTQAEATLTDDEWAEILHEYMQGHQYDPAPVHSPDRTDKGEKWARKVGGAGL